MKKIVQIIKKLKWPVVVLLLLCAVYFSLDFIRGKIIANSFFQKYDVLTVLGDDIFSSKEVQLNGKTIEKTTDGWTNVLPIPQSLKYVLLTSSYSKGHDIKCGDITIPKRVEASNLGENEWCIKHNGKELVSMTSAQYFHYDTNDIVYETCLKSGYYEGVDGGRGFNSCAERGLFLNDKQIAVTKEKMGLNYLTNKKILDDASSFNYHPSKKMGSSIIFSTADGTYSYDTTSNKLKQLNNKQERIEDIFLDKNGKTIFVLGQNNFYENAFLGVAEYEGKTYPNIYSADYIDGNFYILRLVSVENEDGSDLGRINTYELLKNGKKIENIEIDGIAPFGYDVRAVQQFPLCDTGSTIVCVYEDGHYAYKKRVQIPDVYGYDFYAEEMVIDGEWRGDHIPNLIGYSKPIFKSGKLKYLLHTSTMLGEGLYLVDFDKKWSYKSIYYQNGSATTKILDGYQNRLLNVVEK